MADLAVAILGASISGAYVRRALESADTNAEVWAALTMVLEPPITRLAFIRICDRLDWMTPERTVRLDRAGMRIKRLSGEVPPAEAMVRGLQWLRAEAKEGIG